MSTKWWCEDGGDGGSEGGGVGVGKGCSESGIVGGCDVSDVTVVRIMMWTVVMWNDCFYAGWVFK